jgi:hypothetical protein
MWAALVLVMKPLAVLTLLAAGAWHYRRVLPGVGMVAAWVVVTGMQGAMPGEVEGAGLVGALLRFLLSRSTSHKVTVAGFVSGVALARWFVPFAAEKMGLPASILPAVGLVAGLVGIDLARGAMERIPAMLWDRFGKKTETGNESA